MHHHLTSVARMSAGLAIALAVLAGAAAAQQSGSLPLEPIKERGQGVSPAYEGWYRNADGSFSLLVGYFNRNRTEPLEIPVGPNNRIEPGGPDRGQPTHFLPRRQWGVFTIRVPKEFGNQRVTWTIVANGEKNEIPMSLHQNYEVMPFKDPAMGNLPPVVRFEPDGPLFQGPPVQVAKALTAAAGQPTPFVFYASDDGHVDPGTQGRGRGSAPPVSVFLSKFRGPGDVKFAQPRPRVALNEHGRVETTATFSSPGEYVIRVQANDNSGEGGGGFQCCWTNAYVQVRVK